MTCIFCKWATHNDEVTLFSANFVAIKDQYPVTPGHHLVIHRAHKETFFELSKGDFEEVRSLIHSLRDTLTQEDPKITGFNIGANCGLSAGQTIMHVHIHVIPRRDHDCQDPRGGVRGVIAEKQKY